MLLNVFEYEYDQNFYIRIQIYRDKMDLDMDMGPFSSVKLMTIPRKKKEKETSVPSAICINQ